MGNETKTCNVPGCENETSSRGLCSKHYFQLRAGKPENRKEMEKYADKAKRGRCKAITVKPEKPRPAWKETPKNTPPEIEAPEHTPDLTGSGCTIPAPQPQDSDDRDPAFQSSIDTAVNLGCSMFFMGDGVLAINGTRCAVWITIDGQVMTAKITAGPSSLRIM